jgi:hypothetical protein
MTHQIIQTLRRSRRILLAGLGLLIVAGLIRVGTDGRRVRTQSTERAPLIEASPAEPLNPSRSSDSEDLSSSWTRRIEYMLRTLVGSGRAARREGREDGNQRPE